MPALSVAGARVSAHAPFPPPAHRTGRADLPHPALRRDSDSRPTGTPGGAAFTGHVVPSAVAESLAEVIGNMATLPTLDHFQDAPEVRPLASTDITSASTVLRACPPPPTARPVPRGRPVGAAATVGASRVAFVLPVQTCQRHYPGGTVARIGLLPCQRRRRPSPNVRWVGSRSINISRPARRSRTFWPACSRSRLEATLSIEGSGSFVTSTTAPIATGWSNSCQVGIAPTEERRLSRRTDASIFADTSLRAVA